MTRTIAIDVDGVLADYSAGWQGYEHIGDPLPGAVEFTANIAKFADVLIYTTRCCTAKSNGLDVEYLKKQVKDWLDKHGFTYHEIWTGQGKPIFSAIIDDRAVSCRPQEGNFETSYTHAIERAKELSGEAKKLDSK